MGFSVKLLLLLVVAEGPLLFAAGFTFTGDFPQDWKKVAAYNHATREVCHECDNLCPRGPYPFTDAEKSEIAQQWACFVGCRSTCLLQAGPEKYSYDTAVDMCGKACRDQFEIKPGTENLFSTLCIEACTSRVGTARVANTPIIRKVVTYQLEPEAQVVDPAIIAEEQEALETMYDPALVEPYAENGGLPHSNYKTLPHHDFSQISAKTPFEYFVKFIKDPTTDPLLAGAIGIPLVVLLFGIAAYYVVLSKRPQHFKENNNSHDLLEEQQSLTVLHVQIDSDIKKMPPPSDFLDDDFVPPPSPPPKYSEVVQTV